MTSVRTSRADTSTGRRAKRPIVPDQHGAWAFLALPVALAAPRTEWHLGTVALIVAWIAAYPAGWAVTGALAAPRPERFHRALVVWAPVAAVAAGLAVLARPWLVWAGAAYLVGFAISLRFARGRRERALGNDLVLVAQCALVVPIIVAVGAARGWSVPWDRTDGTTWVLTVVCAAALLGSVLHVKSLIRERRNLRFRRLSQVFSLACLAVATVALALDLDLLPLVVPFAAMAARTFLVADPTWRPARIGVVELALLALLGVSAALVGG